MTEKEAPTMNGADRKRPAPQMSGSARRKRLPNVPLRTAPSDRPTTPDNMVTMPNKKDKLKQDGKKRRVSQICLRKKLPHPATFRFYYYKKNYEIYISSRENLKKINKYNAARDTIFLRNDLSSGWLIS